MLGLNVQIITKFIDSHVCEGLFEITFFVLSILKKASLETIKVILACQQFLYSLYNTYTQMDNH